LVSHIIGRFLIAGRSSEATFHGVAGQILHVRPPMLSG
jgi:hypothetical protein